jgi:hypothetical protein
MDTLLRPGLVGPERQPRYLTDNIIGRLDCLRTIKGSDTVLCMSLKDWPYSVMAESHRGDIGVVACRFAAVPPVPGAATCPFAAFPPTPGRDARLIGSEFQEVERGGIKPLRLHHPGGRDSGLKKLVRHKQTQRLFVAARRQAGMGEMNMGERFLALGPAFAGAPKLGDNASLDWALIGRLEQRGSSSSVSLRPPRPSRVIFAKTVPAPSVSPSPAISMRGRRRSTRSSHFL